MNIRLATKFDQPAWDTYVGSHADGLAYHCFAWRIAVKDAYCFDSLYLLAENKGQIRGVLPLIDFKVPLFGRTLISLPYCDVGGVLADGPAEVDALLNEARKIAEQKGIMRIKIRFGKNIIPGVKASGEKFRMVLDLPVSSELLLSRLKSKLRSQVKKPLRDGLTAKLGQSELVEEFYTIFSENMRDLGSPVHGLKWIRAVVSSYGEHVRVGVVYMPDRQPAAAGIILLHKKTISIPWASSLRCFNRMNPNMLLYWTFLAFAADHGYKRFDFGRSTMGEGTYKFKKQWGAEPEPLFWIDLLEDHDCQSSVSGKLFLRECSETIWRRLPLGACNAIGPYLRRYVNL